MSIFQLLKDIRGNRLMLHSYHGRATDNQPQEGEPQT